MAAGTYGSRHKQSRRLRLKQSSTSWFATVAYACQWPPIHIAASGRTCTCVSPSTSTAFSPEIVAFGGGQSIASAGIVALMRRIDQQVMISMFCRRMFLYVGIAWNSLHGSSHR